MALASWYAEGLIEGTSAGRFHWEAMGECRQARVEAASIAIALDMTRQQIWDNLDGGVQERLVSYLGEVVHNDDAPRNNWLWFRICIETFLRSVGGPWSADDLQTDLALHDSLIRGEGWLVDGEKRSFDHYNDWAFHLYPALWQRMVGANELADDARRERDLAMLDRYILDASCLVGADGGPLIQGRSLIYRFAAAAPFWVGAMVGVPSTTLGQLRRAADGIVKHFVDRGAPDERGLLTMGWFDEFPAIAQNYSGPGSPYWASKGLIGLVLPADHPIWTAVEEPLPVEREDFVRCIRAPGWILSGTKADGIVRVANHGTDGALPSELVSDLPPYAMFGYSTSTAPFVDESAFIRPAAQYVALRDDSGHLTHRAGFTTLTLGIDQNVGYAMSRLHGHWVPEEVALRPGQSDIVGDLTVISVVRGPWECRLVHVDKLFETGLTLEIAGWAVPMDPPGTPQDGVSRGAGIEILLTAMQSISHPEQAVTFSRIATGNPLGNPSHAPVVAVPAVAGEWVVVVITLTRVQQDIAAARATITELGGEWIASVTWPDGYVSHTNLPNVAP